MLLQVRAASDMYITGCFDHIDLEEVGDSDSDVICLDEEEAAESERRKLAMSPRAPATKGEAHANKNNSEEEETGEDGRSNEDDDKDNE